jgi:hypothetical protein
MQVLPNGIGVSEGGHVLLNRSPLQLSGNVWFVDSASGADAASPRGLNAEYPLATIGQAHTNAGSGDVIVLRSTHSETVAASVAISKDVMIIGEGRVSGVPSATLINAAAAGAMLDISALGIRIINVRFVQDPAAPDGHPHLELIGTIGSYVSFCQFETGEVDTAHARVTLGLASYATIEDCVFKSTCTDPTAPPKALLDAATGACNGLVMKRCTFDGGQSGFADQYAVDFNTFGVTRMYFEDLSFLNGADIGFKATCAGVVHGTATGQSRMVWS